LPEEVIVVSSVAAALEMVQETLQDKVETVFVIGGAEIYREAMNMTVHNLKEKRNGFYCDKLYFTLVQMDNVGCDAYFPALDQPPYSEYFHDQTTTTELLQENGVQYQFKLYSTNLNK
jgi:dihydrofolate reductase